MSLDTSAGNSILETLDRQVASLADSIRPADVFRRLLDGARSFAPRAAILLLREGGFRGWGTAGYPSGADDDLRRLRIPAADGPLDRLAAPGGAEGVVPLPADELPGFGKLGAAETLGVPLRVGPRTIGVLIAQRGIEEEPWFPAALGVLATAARLRLELDLTLRKLRPRDKAAEPAGKAPAGPPEEAATSAPAATVESSITPWREPAPSGPEKLRQDEARRFARLVATDIRLYHEEAVVEGRRNRDLFRRLEEQIDRGREAFERRFPDLGVPGMTFLHEAYVEILAGGDADLLPSLAADTPPPDAT
jgi:hypothetical protein